MVAKLLDSKKPWSCKNGRKKTKKWTCMTFLCNDCAEEQNGSPYFSSIVRQCKWPSLSWTIVEVQEFCYHGNETSQFYSSQRQSSPVLSPVRATKLIKGGLEPNTIARSLAKIAENALAGTLRKSPRLKYVREKSGKNKFFKVSERSGNSVFWFIVHKFSSRLWNAFSLGKDEKYAAGQAKQSIWHCTPDPLY